MPTNKDFLAELDFYFRQFKTNTIAVYGNAKDDNGNKTTPEIISIDSKITDNGVRYFVNNTSRETQEISEKFYHENDLLKLIHRELRLFNDDYRNNHLKKIEQILSDFTKAPLSKTRSFFSHENALKKTNHRDHTYYYQALSPSIWQRLTSPFSLINSCAKRVTRWVLLDNFISKFVLGGLIAYVANRGNSHYKTKAQTVSETLGKLIFPAGLKRPNITTDGKIFLGPVLTRQYTALMRFESCYGKYNDNPVFKPFKIKIDETTLLDGVEAKNTINKADNETLHVIYFNGNSGCYEARTSGILHQLDYYAEHNIAAKAVLFNYPGVLKSQGLVDKAQDLITAGIAQVERLHQQQGIPYDKIALHGVSLGGSIAAHVAAYYHSRGTTLEGTYLAKTFSSTTNVGLSYVQKLPLIGGLLGIVSRPILALGLWGSRWQLDTAKQYSSLPRDKRDYSVVRSDKKTRKEYQPKDDSVLFHQTSLHESWRLRLQRFFHKHGWFGYDKSTYKRLNHARKMSVYLIDDEDQPAKLAPTIDGHTVAGHMLDGAGSILYHRGIGDNSEKKKVIHPANPIKGIPEKIIKVGQEASQRACSFFIAQEKKETEKIDCTKTTSLPSLTTAF